VFSSGIGPHLPLTVTDAWATRRYHDEAPARHPEQRQVQLTRKVAWVGAHACDASQKGGIGA